MRRAPAQLTALVLAAITVTATSIAAASAQPSASASHRGTEHFTFMLTSRTGAGSAIATGLFTDGGTMKLFGEGPSAEMKLGAGTIRFTPHGHPSSKTDPRDLPHHHFRARHLQAQPRHRQIRRHPRLRPLHGHRPRSLTPQSQRRLHNRPPAAGPAGNHHLLGFGNAPPLTGDKMQGQLGAAASNRSQLTSARIALSSGG